MGSLGVKELIAAALVSLIIGLPASARAAAHTHRDYAALLRASRIAYDPANSADSNLSDAAFERAMRRKEKKALEEIGPLKPGSEVAKLLEAHLRAVKPYSTNYAALAYVLGYNGIDVPKNIHRLRLATAHAGDRDVQFPDGEEDCEAAPQAAIKICKRYPSPAAIREMVSIHSDGAGQEEFAQVLGPFMLNKTTQCLASVAGYPAAESAFAENIFDEQAGEDYQVGRQIWSKLLILKHSKQPGVRSAARFCIAWSKRRSHENLNTIVGTRSWVSSHMSCSIKNGRQRKWD